MADEKKEDKDDEKQEAPPAKKSNAKLFIIIGVALVVVIAIVVTLVLVLGKGSAENESLGADAATSVDEEPVEEGTSDEDQLEEGEEPLGAIFPLETQVVNLSGGGFIKIQIQLEFIERDVPARFYNRIVPLKDSVLSVLASKRKEDIQNKEGRETLKNDLKEIINDLLKKEEIKNIYFTQFVIQ